MFLSITTQVHNDGSVITMEVKKKVVTLIGSLGLVMTLFEILSYIIFFHHIYLHNNNVAANLLQPSVIRY